MKLELYKSYRTRGGWKATVVSLDNHDKNYPVIAIHHMKEGDMVYSHKIDGSFDHGPNGSDLIEEWRDPLTAEFECEWKRGELATHPTGIDVKKILYPFIGKRTKVTITEIL